MTRCEAMRRPARLGATAVCLNFGAWTVTLGSGVLTVTGVGCAIATPLTQHSGRATDMIEAVLLAAKSDENFMAMSSQMHRRLISDVAYPRSQCVRPRFCHAGRRAERRLRYG